MTICVPGAAGKAGGLLPVTLVNGVAGDDWGAELWAKYGLTDWWDLSAGFNWLKQGFPIPSRASLT